MATKLGDRLIAKRAITQTQLDKALNAQLIVGGHLGTCLIELGMIDESTLGTALSEAFGVPHAPSEALEGIPESTIALVPAKLAEEYRVVPFRMTDKVLHMAMVDPGNLRMLDALSFATDRRIVPWVAPELRIYQALEHYYGVPRRLRFIGICEALDGTATGKGPAHRQAGGNDVEGAKESSPDAAKSASKASADSPSTATIGSIGGSEQDFADYLYGKNWLDVAAELRLDDTAIAPTKEPTAANRGSSFDKGRGTKHGATHVEVAEMLCRADRNAEMAEAVFAYTAHRMERSLLFSVQKNTASVWHACGFSKTLRKDARLPLKSGAFGLLLGNEHYRGEVPKEETYDGFYRQMGVVRPREVLLIPIYLSDRLVAVFHGDNGPDKPIDGETDDYLRLIRLFSLTLNLLVMKNRIRDTALPPTEIRKAKKP